MVSVESLSSSQFESAFWERPPLVTHHCNSIVDELRGWSRFRKERGTDVAIVFRPRREPLLADVHDESLAGISLYQDDIEGCHVGDEVEMIYENQFFRARVRHVEPQDEDGQYIVGFECERTDRF